MAKRHRKESRRVQVSGFHSGVPLTDVVALFNRFGSIEQYWPTGSSSCVIQFESAQDAEDSQTLDGKVQVHLLNSRLSVITEEDRLRKKQNYPIASYAVLDNPRFNNYFIPILPLYLSTNRLGTN